MDTNTVVIKCNLDVIAKRRKIGAYEIAKVTGISNPTIYGLLAGKSPTLDTLTKLANGLKLSPAQLLRAETVPVVRAPRVKHART